MAKKSVPVSAFIHTTGGGIILFAGSVWYM